MVGYPHAKTACNTQDIMNKFSACCALITLVSTTIFLPTARSQSDIKIPWNSASEVTLFLDKKTSVSDGDGNRLSPARMKIKLPSLRHPSGNSFAEFSARSNYFTVAGSDIVAGTYERKKIVASIERSIATIQKALSNPKNKIKLPARCMSDKCDPLKFGEIEIQILSSAEPPKILTLNLQTALDKLAEVYAAQWIIDRYKHIPMSDLKGTAAGTELKAAQKTLAREKNFVSHFPASEDAGSSVEFAPEASKGTH